MVRRTTTGRAVTRQRRTRRRRRRRRGDARSDAVGAVHHFDKLAAFQHEEQVGVALEQARVQVLRRVDGLAHASR